MSQYIGKGTVKLVIDGGTYGCDECSVTRKLSNGWKTANITSIGSSLPLSTSSVLDIYFERGTVSVKRMDGYVTSVSEQKDGRDITYNYEIYGREAFVNYRLYKPSSKNTIAGSFITDLVTSIGYPTPKLDASVSALSITLDNINPDYVHNYLRYLNDKYAINYYYETGLTLNAFINTPSTLTNFVTLATNRDRVNDITNVFNKGSLHTDSIYINESYDEFRTEVASEISNWHYKRFKQEVGDKNKLIDDPERHCDTSSYCSKGTMSVHATGETFDMFGEGGDTTYRFGCYFIVDLGENYGRYGDYLGNNVLSYINYDIAVKTSPSTHAFTYSVVTEIMQYQNDYPPQEMSYIEQCSSYYASSPEASGSFITNGGFKHVSVNVPFMTDSAPSKGQAKVARYIGIHVNCDFPPSGEATYTTFDVYVDNLHVQKTTSTIFVDEASTLAVGLREFKPDNNGYVVAFTTAELADRVRNVVKSNPEDSIRKLRFPGSVGTEVGNAVNLVFDDYTKVYKIEEVRDEYSQATGEWMQELSVSSSPICMPKTKIAENLRYLNDKVKNIGNTVEVFNYGGYSSAFPFNRLALNGIDAVEGKISSLDINEASVIAFNSIGTITKIDSVGIMACNTISSIGEISNVGIMACNTITSIGSMNALIASFNTIGSVGSMNVGIFAASTIGAVGQINSIGLVKISSFGTIGNIDCISTVQTASFYQIGNIDNITRIGTMDVEKIGVVNNIGSIGSARIGNLTNVGEINIEHCYNIDHLDTLGAVGTINNVEWLEHIDRFGTINTINTVYRIDILESCGSIGANVMWIGSANVGTMETGVAIFDNATINTMNVTGFANLVNASISTMNVTGPAVFGSATVNNLTVSSTLLGNFIIGNANIGSLSITSDKIANLAITSNKMANTISINTGTIGNLISTTANISTISGITNLNATNASIGTITGIGNLYATNASITSITNTIANFNAVNANIGTISNIGQLVGLNNNITLANGTTLSIPTAATIYNIIGTSMNIANATITNFLVNTISANTVNITGCTINNLNINNAQAQLINVTTGTIQNAYITQTGSMNVMKCNNSTIQNLNITNNGSFMTFFANRSTIESVNITGTISGSTISFAYATITTTNFGNIYGSSFNFTNAVISQGLNINGALVGNGMDFTNATIDALNVTGLASLGQLSVTSATITNISVTGSLIGSNIVNSTNIGTLIIDADNIGVLEVKHFPAVVSDNVRASGGHTIQFSEQLSGSYRIKFTILNYGYNNYDYGIVVYANTSPVATISDSGYWDGTDYTWNMSYDVSVTIPAAGRIYLDITGGSGVEIGALNVCYDITQYRNYSSW